MGRGQRYYASELAKLLVVYTQRLDKHLILGKVDSRLEQANEEKMLRIFNGICIANTYISITLKQATDIHQFFFSTSDIAALPLRIIHRLNWIFLIVRIQFSIWRIGSSTVFLLAKAYEQYKQINTRKPIKIRLLYCLLAVVPWVLFCLRTCKVYKNLMIAPHFFFFRFYLYIYLWQQVRLQYIL